MLPAGKNLVRAGDDGNKQWPYIQGRFLRFPETTQDLSLDDG